MVDRCTITRGTTHGTLNTVTGLYGATTPTTIYEGECSLLTPDPAAVREHDEEPLTVAGSYLKVPMAAGPFKIGDLAVVDKVTDREPGQRRWRVTAIAPKRWSTHRRLEVEEVTPGG